MTNEALLDAYEREWRSLMDKINEIEHRIVQLKKDIAIEKSAQHSVYLTAGILSPKQSYPTMKWMTPLILSNQPAAGKNDR